MRQDRSFAAVAFDLDGTLIDSTEGIVATFEAAYAELELPYPGRDAVASTISLPLEDQLSELSIREAETFIEVYRRHYAQIASGHTHLFPGAESLLRSLYDAGIPLAIASSKSKPAAEHLLRHLGVLDLFAICLGREDVTHAKPHPEALLRVANEFNVAPHRMVYVGDSAFDVEAANRAGMAFIGVSTGAGGRAALERADPRLTFSDLAAVGEFLSRRVGSASADESAKGKTRERLPLKRAKP